MIGELVVRFVLGGLIVSAFAVIGDVFKPKTFSGLFGAAPSVALATLGLAFANEGDAYVRDEGRSMLIGAVALLVYSAVCVVVTRRTRLPVWLAAGAAWVAWLAIAFGAFGAGTKAGVLR